MHGSEDRKPDQLKNIYTQIKICRQEEKHILVSHNMTTYFNHKRNKIDANIILFFNNIKQSKSKANISDT